MTKTFCDRCGAEAGEYEVDVIPSPNEMIGKRDVCLKCYNHILECCNTIINNKRSWIAIDHRPGEAVVESPSQKILKEFHDIEQILAQAIGGFPWFKDDKKNFPEATDADGVCVGDHSAVTLAMTIAKKLEEARELIDKEADEKIHWNADLPEKEGLYIFLGYDGKMTCEEVMRITGGLLYTKGNDYKKSLRVADYIGIRMHFGPIKNPLA